MTKTRILFIATIYHLKIAEDLGEGLEIANNIKITNNRNTINALLTPELSEAIGKLEENALLTADAVFYATPSIEIDDSSHDGILCNYLGECNIFMHDLWGIKDHSANTMIGFIHYSPRAESVVTHSNKISTWFTTSDGNCIDILFTKSEVQKAINITESETRKTIPFSEASVKASLLEKGIQRIALASILVQTARTQNDLGVKISHYCTALEGLFTTDNMELSHKLSERVACFLETDPQKKFALFKEIKKIYSVRSDVVHGSSIKKFNDLPDISKQADSILRRVLFLINASPHLDRYFRKQDKEGLEEYMNSLVFGANPL